MQFVKKFCRLVVEEELGNRQVAEFYDIVQSIIPTKIITAYTDDGEKVESHVTAYNSASGGFIYEIVLEHQVDLDEGEEIADELGEVFEFNFDLETSLEI